MGANLFAMSEPPSYSEQSFLEAVAKGDEATVRSLLNRHDLEAVGESGSTALCCACKNRRHRIVEMLLDSGASVDTRCGDVGETALHKAAVYGSEDILALLLSRGADVRAANRDGYTALHIAAIEGSEDTVALLLSGGADVHAVNRDCETALHLAASVGFGNKVKMLLSYGSIADCVDYFGFSALASACMGGKSKVANLLIRSGANIHWVCDSGKFKGFTLLHVAAKGDLADTIQLLLDLKAADVDAVSEDGCTALHIACSQWSIKAALCLLKNAAQVNYACRKSGFTALHLASENQSLEIIKLLLKYEADLNAENDEGKTPLSFSLEDEDPSTEMIEIFVKQLVKMKEQNLFLSESNVKVLSEYDEIKDFRASCENEIRKMRVCWIGDSNVKMYDILTKGVNRLSDYVSNDSVELILESENYKAEYPIYASEVHERFIHGRERRDLLTKSSEWLWTVMNEFYEIPYILVERINRCLTNGDLALQISRDEPNVSPILSS